MLSLLSKFRGLPIAKEYLEDAGPGTDWLTA